MNPTPQKVPLITWWVLWLALTTGLIVISQVLKPTATAPADPILKYFPVIPLAISSFIRWILIPKASDATRAFTFFIIGMALSEGCGILGTVVVPELAQTYLILGLLGIIQFIPFYASKFES